MKFVEYEKNDHDAARKQLKEDKDSLIKEILVKAKSIDPFSEEGGKAGEMTQVMTTIASIDAMMSQSVRDEMTQTTGTLMNEFQNQFEDQW